MTVTVFGIKNCDTMKKACLWLKSHHVDYAFHDYKVCGIELAMLTMWASQVGWQTLLNRAGTTFRKLDEDDKHDLTETKAILLMKAQPSLIKRPVIVDGSTLVVGFAPDRYAAVFNKR